MTAASTATAALGRAGPGTRAVALEADGRRVIGLAVHEDAVFAGPTSRCRPP